MDEVQQALRATEKRADEAYRALRDQVGTLSLGEAATAFARLGELVEQLWRMNGLLVQRTEEIRDRELIERREESSLNMTDTAVNHLSYGNEAVMAGVHLLRLGRCVLAQVADDQPVTGENTDGDGVQ